MPKRSGKGRISYNLVAASCAAVLTVYTAGYWRTRDAARQFDMQAKGRRPGLRTHPMAAIIPPPALIEPASPALQPPIDPSATSAATAAAAPRRSPAVSARRASHAPAGTGIETAEAPAANSSSAVAASQNTPSPAATGNVVYPVPMTPEPIAAAPPESGPAATPAAHWRDGAYTGHGNSPHGDLDVRVVIKEGRIIEATIEACNTRYPCELLNPLLHQTLRIQSANVDYVSRATESSDAYSEGLLEALNAALYQPPGKDAASQ